MKSLLVLLLILIGSQHSYSAQAPSSNKLVLSYNYPEIFRLTREFFYRPAVRKALNEAFKEALKLSPEEKARRGETSDSVELTESQFIFVLQRIPYLWPRIRQYLNEVPNESTMDPALLASKQAWIKELKNIIATEAVVKRLHQMTDATEPTQLVTKPGEVGFSDLQFFADHPMKTKKPELVSKLPEDKYLTYTDKKTGDKTYVIRASNLKQLWIDLIKGAKKEITLNVFEFNLKEIADLLIQRKKDGLDVNVGIDDEVFAIKNEGPSKVPENNLYVYEKLKEAGVNVKLINSVGLNHQKMAAFDWSDRNNAKVLFSSGNLTQSCIGPEGDLVDQAKRPKSSVPNANHTIIMKSYVLAQLVHHQIEKILDGNRIKLPSGGTFLVNQRQPKLGESVSRIVLAFSPHGGLGDLNRDVIGKVIERTTGPVKLAQFAFSSSSTANSLFKRFITDIDLGHSVDFELIGDKEFSSPKYSNSLLLSGLKREDSEDKKRRYIPFTDQEWTDRAKALSEEVDKERAATKKACVDKGFDPAKKTSDELCSRVFGLIDDIEKKTQADPTFPEKRLQLIVSAFKELKNKVFIAPPQYDRHNDFIDKATGKVIQYNAKLHHKVLVAGDSKNGLAIAGTSFNFSDNANANNEQLLVFSDPYVIDMTYAMIEGLKAQVKSTVTKLVSRSIVDDQDLEDPTESELDDSEHAPLALPGQ